MFEMRDDDLVALADMLHTPRFGDQIDRLGGAAHENDLTRRAGIDKAPNAFARPLESLSRGLTQRMHSAMDVGMRVRLVMLDRTQYRVRSLR